MLKHTIIAAALFASAVAYAAPVQVEERSIDQLAGARAADLVAAYKARVARIDRAGPAINSVVLVNPHAASDAARVDADGRHGLLHGMPILIKDNIESLDPMPTTAGSLALAANTTGRDAPLVARLRAAGAVILGKTNLSEWANIRSTRSTSGWSAVGGLTRNAYALDRNTCGSSSGTGAAIAASLAVAGIGTETDGSITCPASINGLVGLKPTVGLVSRTHIVPISHSQDTAGPMARSVRDAALLLTVIAGSDPADPATAPADRHKTDYAARLRPDALRGARLGVLRFAVGGDPKVTALFEAAVADLKRQGAEIVEIDKLDGRDAIGTAEQTVLSVELKVDLNAYLATTPAAVTTRTLADVIAFDKAHPAEMRWFGQELFDAAELTKGLDDADYKKARAASFKAAGPDGIDKLIKANRVTILIAPTQGPSWTTDLVNGDHVVDIGAGSLAAVAGYPHLTVPMGLVEGLPVGLSFIGPAWSEADLLAAGYAYEQATRRRRPPTYARTLALPAR